MSVPLAHRSAGRYARQERHPGGARLRAEVTPAMRGLGAGAPVCRRVAVTALRTTIVPQPPFAFDLVLEYLRTSPSTVTEVVTADACLRAVRLLDRDVVVQIGPAHPDGRLEVCVHGEGVGPAHLQAAVALAERVLAARADVRTLEHDLAADPVLGALAQRYRGLRPVLIADPLEALVWAIIGQQITVAFAAKLKRALAEHFGRRLRRDGRELLLFPDAETLAGLEHERDLRPLQFSRQKSAYVIGVARAVAAGTLDLEALRRMEPEEALARLAQLKGVGRWTAEYVLLRGLGFPDVIPAADGGLRRIIGRAYSLGRSATEAEVRALAARWAPWRSYAAFYWWFTLQRERSPGPELSAAG
jgi:DNA-3-methyladenine glycosylase II